MDVENAIVVDNITKSFKVYLDRSDDAKSFFLHQGRRKYENRNVIRGISFTVKKGEAVGLIGSKDADSHYVSGYRKNQY